MLKFNQGLKLTFLFFVAIFFSLSTLFIHSPIALSHRPHDVVDQIELSPNYDKNQTLFIIVRGNLLKSEDGGKSWKRLWKGLDNPDNLRTLAISSKNDNLLFTSSFLTGIYKSQDGGQSWTKVNNGLILENSAFYLVEISPNSDDFVVAVDRNKGIYKTENGGKNWTQIFKNEKGNKIIDISFVKDQPSTILVTNDLGSIKISQDAGQTWNPFFTAFNGSKITTLEVSPNFKKDKTIWIGTEKNGVFKVVDGNLEQGSKIKELSNKIIKNIAFSPNYNEDKTVFISTWNQGIFRSQDNGKTWQNFNQGLTKSEQANEKQFKAPHFDEIRISNNFKSNKTLFLSGFDGIFKSTNGGKTWQNLDSLSSRIVIGIAVSPNYKNDETIAIIDYVGAAHISYDKGKSWSSMKSGLELPKFTKSLRVPSDDPRRFFDIAFSPNYAEDKTLFLGLLRDNILKSSDAGKHWNIIKLPGVPNSFVRGTFLAISPNIAEDNTVYVATNAGTIYKSTDKGDTFSVLSQLKTRITSLKISPNFSTDKTLYVSSFNGIFQSLDQGESWQQITQEASLENIFWWGLAISPNYQEDKTLIAGGSNGLFKTVNTGKTWVRINSLPYDKNPAVSEIAISPNYKNDKTFMTTPLGKGTFKTVDDGQTFSMIDDGQIYLSRLDTVPTASIPIQFSPSYSEDNTIYGFGSIEPEIYQSTDQGKTWNIIPIPESRKNLLDYINYIPFLIYADRLHLFKLIVALVIAALSYFILSYIALKSSWKFNNLVIKLAGTAIIFWCSLLVLYN
ncbi:MAG: YCF48-related protein [Crocosphaera sp.]